MNIARMLGVSRDLDEAVVTIATGRTRLIDVGEANGVTFYETASVGLNAAMFSTAQHFEDGDYGSPMKVLWTAFRYRPARMQVQLDSERDCDSSADGHGLERCLYRSRDDGRAGRAAQRRPVRRTRLSALLEDRADTAPRVDRFWAAALLAARQHLSIGEGSDHVATPAAARADSHDLGTTPLECASRRAALRVIVGPDFVDGQTKQRRLRGGPRAGAPSARRPSRSYR